MMPSRLTPEELAAIDRVTQRAREAHDRFVRELDGLMYDLRDKKDEHRDEPPRERPADERSEPARRTG
jgi:hypothetical protein